MRTDLREDPAVIAIAEALKIEEDLVVGKLHRIWSWASRQLRDGNAHVTLMYVDRHVECVGFAQAMRNAGWLEVADNGLICFPKFDGTCRKVPNKGHLRRLACVTIAAYPSVTREEKRRGECIY